MARRDVYCYDCEKYFENVNISVSCCPECGSDDSDVYPEAEWYNREIEESRFLHKEFWITNEKCDKCQSKMIYRDDGHDKIFVCRNSKCNFTKPLRRASGKLSDLKIKRIYSV